MFLIKNMIILILLITNLMILISLIISKKNNFDQEKMSPFECGFDPKSLTRLPFSIQFFIITIIFLIFDVEISIILPLIFSIKLTNMMSWYVMASVFISILLLGIMYEWYQNLLNWKF
uniref:NADH-ubiquinone oxidoreductase chain 3 n=1 Tax=Maesaipsyche stengeli TaxID=2904894 RepID=A0A9E8LNK2_9NEOP|nr:NADH dehydrogenase subunit 3 [Maesaipsyche stengeli]UZZ43655.1 NADH dehydrogenase subunit 3 [Maesaipsyche stengeli]